MEDLDDLSEAFVLLTDFSFFKMTHFFSFPDTVLFKFPFMSL